MIESLLKGGKFPSPEAIARLCELAYSEGLQRGLLYGALAGLVLGLILGYLLGRDRSAP